MRILILTANTGGGHNSTASALAQQLEKLHVEYKTADTLAYISEKVSELISKGHSYLYRKFPKLFGAGYRFEEKHPAYFLYDQCARGAQALQQELSEQGYDAVLCVHVFSALMMTEVRRRYANPTPFYFIATDYTASPGVSEMKADAYFIPHRMLLGEFVRNGVTADKMFASGIPVSGTFYEKQSKEDARIALSLPVDGKMVLLSCGSMGCGNLEKSALTLLRHLADDAYLVVLCGRNEKAYEALFPHQSGRLFVLPFTKEVPSYMSAADVYITKPGGLTTSEAIVKQVPMVLVNAVPGCETRNFQFLVRSGVALGAKSWKQAMIQTNHALQHPDVLEQQQRNMKLFTLQNAAEMICRRVVSDGKEAH